ncbi:helix-turn-helix domain-containing protein [Angustibacter peucedani]
MPTRRPLPHPDDDHLVLTDPHALRALAHPARAAVVDELYQGKVRTSSQLAELTGLTPSAMSYHLRALEKWGIVARADSVDGRERPWKAAARGFSWAGRDRGSSASDVVMDLYLDRLGRDLAAWRRAEPDEGDAWHDVSTVHRGFPFLTADELRELNEGVYDLVKRLVGRRDESDHPDDARRVAFFFASAPLVDDAPDPSA